MKSVKINDSEVESIKILLIGLANSGKTSILTCLKGIKHISAFNSPMPTKGVDVQQFEALNSKYAVWDIGGQKTFLEEFFNDSNRYLREASKIIYVIDVQDVGRYEEAIEYLERVIDSIGKNRNIDFSIFLHKFDPDIKFNQELNEEVIKNLIKKIKEIISPKFLYSLYKTSIYAIFEKATII